MSDGVPAHEVDAGARAPAMLLAVAVALGMVVGGVITESILRDRPGACTTQEPPLPVVSEYHPLAESDLPKCGGPSEHGDDHVANIHAALDDLGCHLNRVQLLLDNVQRQDAR